MNTTHPDPVAAKKLREELNHLFVLHESYVAKDYCEQTSDTRVAAARDKYVAAKEAFLAAITTYLPATTQLPLAGEANITGETSDGYHTFNELYDHRCTLFLALMRCVPAISWISTKHEDGSTWGGWFIAGMKLPTGDVTYHLPARMWSLACATGAAILETGFHWDGHTSTDVVERIQAWLSMAYTPPSAPTNGDAAPNAGAERLSLLAELHAVDTDFEFEAAYSTQKEIDAHVKGFESAQDKCIAVARKFLGAPAGNESTQHATNDATPGATGSQHVGNGVTAPSSWAVEAAKEIRSTVYWPKDVNEADIHKIAAIIAKHHARHAQSAGDGKDADRYRWLRHMIFDDRIMVAPDRMLHGDALDAAIDAAMAQEGKP